MQAQPKRRSLNVRARAPASGKRCAYWSQTVNPCCCRDDRSAPLRRLHLQDDLPSALQGDGVIAGRTSHCDFVVETSRDVIACARRFAS
jgi:hypothetical protein